MGRTIALFSVLAFLVLLGGLTVSVASVSGITPLVVVAGIILALFAFGVVGALFNPPDK